MSNTWPDWWTYAALSMAMVVIALQVVLLLRAGTTREAIGVRLRDLLAGLERLERELRQELSLGRQEAASAARGDREEQSLSLDRLSQTLAAQQAQLGRLQAQQLESFAQQLARLTNSNEQRFEELRQALEQPRKALRGTSPGPGTAPDGDAGRQFRQARGDAPDGRRKAARDARTTSRRILQAGQ